MFESELIQVPEGQIVPLTRTDMSAFHSDIQPPDAVLTATGAATLTCLRATLIWTAGKASLRTSARA